MTLTLNLTPEQEARLNAQALAAGLDPAAYVLHMIEQGPEPKGLLPGETLLDAFERLGAVGVIDAPPRPDGKAWSQCEGFE